ncbi:MAG TPA: hypothetical protein VH541_05735 [Gaiellaceae bacterium]|jgi:hypothetical protein
MGAIKISVTRIRKGDRFTNEYWGGRTVIATTDAYRLDGTVDPEHYHPTKPKPCVAECERTPDGVWRPSWWRWEVGITDGNGAGGGWSAREDERIVVEREKIDPADWLASTPSPREACRQAREWLLDLEWEGESDRETIELLNQVGLVAAIERYYDGGWGEFVRSI